MKVLVATRQTQGRRENDFSWTIEGELVIFPPLECSCGEIDDGCGCRRSMAGLTSHRATTTVKVAEIENLDPEIYQGLIVQGLKDQGYVENEMLSSADVIGWLRDATSDLMIIAKTFDAGTVLERRGGWLYVREKVDQAENAD